MSEQLDYEETRARLRAQLAATSARRHVLPGIRRRWSSLAATVVVVGCAVVVTVSLTRTAPRAEVTLVPSAGHEGSGHVSTSEHDPSRTTTATTTSADPAAGVAAAVVDATGALRDPLTDVVVDPETTAADADVAGSPAITAGDLAPVAGPVAPAAAAPASTRPRGGGSPAGGTAPTPGPAPTTQPTTGSTPAPTVDPPNTGTPTGENPGPGSDPAGGQTDSTG